LALSTIENAEPKLRSRVLFPGCSRSQASEMRLSVQSEMIYVSTSSAHLQAPFYVSIDRGFTFSPSAPIVANGNLGVMRVRAHLNGDVSVIADNGLFIWDHASSDWRMVPLPVGLKVSDVSIDQSRKLCIAGIMKCDLRKQFHKEAYRTCGKNIAYYIIDSQDLAHGMQLLIADDPGNPFYHLDCEGSPRVLTCDLRTFMDDFSWSWFASKCNIILDYGETQEVKVVDGEIFKVVRSESNRITCYNATGVQFRFDGQRQWSSRDISPAILKTGIVPKGCSWVIRAIAERLCYLAFLLRWYGEEDLGCERELGWAVLLSEDDGMSMSVILSSNKSEIHVSDLCLIQDKEP
jgi:hypothetical protein